MGKNENVQKGLGLKNMSDFVKKIWGIFETKNTTVEKKKKYKK